jgi:hypothetical protein
MFDAQGGVFLSLIRSPLHPTGHIFWRVPKVSIPELQVRGRKDWWNSCLSGLFMRVSLPGCGSQLKTLQVFIGFSPPSLEWWSPIDSFFRVQTCDDPQRVKMLTIQRQLPVEGLVWTLLWKALDQWFCAPRFQHGLLNLGMLAFEHISFWAPILLDVSELEMLLLGYHFKAGIHMTEAHQGWIKEMFLHPKNCTSHINTAAKSNQAPESSGSLPRPFMIFVCASFIPFQVYLFELTLLCGRLRLPKNGDFGERIDHRIISFTHNYRRWTNYSNPYT